MSKQKLIRLKLNDDIIIIAIPAKLLQFAWDNSPDSTELGKVKDYKKLAKDVLHYLRHYENEDDGLTGLQRLLDMAMMDSYESGSKAFYEPPKEQ